MILILSIDGDLTTDQVINWLKSCNYPYFRLNAFDLLEDRLLLDFNNRRLVLNDQVVDLDAVGVVWNRKFGFHKNSHHYKLASKTLDQRLLEQLSKEFKALLASVYAMLWDKNWLVRPDANQLNKIYALRAAAAAGMDVPRSYAANRCSELEGKGSLITKSILDPYLVHAETGSFTMYTSRLEKKWLERIPETFFPSLVQTEIPKEYEVRVFYLLGNLYSMSIFSQGSTQTEVDFRRYLVKRPNRYVPYQLPSGLARKVRQLMQHLNLNSGSLDFIKGKDGKYYFLEVNPAGQFGMVDFACNYGLHKKVAEALMHMDKNNEPPNANGKTSRNRKIYRNVEAGSAGVDVNQFSNGGVRRPRESRK